MRPHRQQPTRLPHPWDSPGKSTGGGAIAFSVCQCYSLRLSYPLLPPLCPQVPSLYLHLYYCPANIKKFISTIILDSLSIYMLIWFLFVCFYMIFCFFWLILYDRFWVRPHHLCSISREQPSWMAWLYSWALTGASTLHRMPCVFYHLIFLTTCWSWNKVKMCSCLHTLTSFFFFPHTLTSKGI